MKIGTHYKYLGHLGEGPIYILARFGQDFRLVNISDGTIIEPIELGFGLGQCIFGGERGAFTEIQIDIQAK